MPQVTVIIPNYNHARYLPQRIESVLQQTEKDIEILLLDDCSPDNSREIIAHYAALDPRIQVVLNEKNSGSTFHQWNKGFSLAKGEYIWIAESDDYADPRLLETLLRPLRQDPSIGFAYCESRMVDEENNYLGLFHIMSADLDEAIGEQDFVKDGMYLIQQYMSYCNIVPNASAVLMRRSVVEKAGPADSSYRLNGDWLFWAKMMVHSRVAFIATPMNYFRQHTNKVSSTVMRSGLALVEEAKVIRAMQIYGPPNKINYEKKIENIINKWFYALMNNHQMPWSLHRQLYAELCALDSSFPKRLRRGFFKILFSKQFSGVRQLVGDGILKRVLPQNGNAQR